MAKKEDPFSNIRNLRNLSGTDPAEQDSWRWFRRNVNKLYKGTKLGFDDVVQGLTESGPQTRKSGKMYMFRYLPKGMGTLPYYDTFPLVLTLTYTRKYVTGLNLHYLPPKYRQRLFNSLNDITNNKKYDNTTRIKMTYDILKSFKRFRFYKPCFKKYLRKRMRSEMLFVPPADWNIAINLPTEKFRKASKRRVWTDSVNSIK
tara:strand:- start:38 stop:643 length:606 start_codon:yes stop_codon:yes gene_type:complete